jgi:two-component system sensor histidine kinase PilS (NtrC family)
MPLTATGDNLRTKLKWLMAGRVIIVTLLLGGATLVQMTRPVAFQVDPFFFLIGLNYALTIVYALALKYAERHRWWADVQLAGDALTVSAFVLVTGGIVSYFSSLYVLPIIAASTLQFRRGALTLAVLSAILYSTLVVSQYLSNIAGWGSPIIFDSGIPLPPFRVAQYTIATNVFGFFAVALLSGSLAENLRSADDKLQQASDEIADWQAFNQHVIDSLISGLATTDYSGRIISFNHAAETIIGRSAVSVIGRRISDVMKFPDDFAAALGAHLAGAVSRRTEYRYLTGDGREIEVGIAASHLNTPGGRAGFLFTFQDVTDIKQLERDARLRQRLAAVGEMAAGIAHEIRNPLASMSGSIQILRQELPLSEEQAQLMDIVLRESDRLNDTIRSFLAYARPQRFSVKRLDLRSLLSDTAILLRNSAEVGDGHIIDVNVPETPVEFDADEGQIRQVVWNLATNGLRAMKTGGRLGLGTHIDRGDEPDASDSPSSHHIVVLEVSDEGVGIPPEELDGIFQPFHGSFAKGSGLGLSIVHRIVTDYGGEIHVTSSPGAGTTMRVRLPVRATAELSATEAS